MKRSEPQSVGEIFDEVIRSAHLQDQFLAQKALQMWGEVMGQPVNRRTARRYVDAQGVMHVVITSGPLKSELEFMKSRIVERLNEAVGAQAIKGLMIH